MAALTERFQGLRRPGASLLKKGLPSRPDEPIIARKAVPPPKVTLDPASASAAAAAVAAASSATSTSTSNVGPGNGAAGLHHKNLPLLPNPASPPTSTPTVSLTPSSTSIPSTSSYSSPASTATITPSPASPPTTQNGRPPRTTSLKDPQPTDNPPQQRPQNKFVSHLQVNGNNSSSSSKIRPVSEAPSISQFIPDPEPEPEFYPETDGAADLARNARYESENSSERTPTSSVRNSDSNSDSIQQYPDGYIPPIPETIIIPPLTPVHYGCFTAHATMPAASNVWYATACMTCKKVDQEVRHRCTFCCIRICAPCYESLQTCKNRSLTELMRTKL